jgi:cytochrome c biogenesis protein CcmG/thiol:disulfide interchange protein DsbE
MKRARTLPALFCLLTLSLALAGGGPPAPRPAPNFQITDLNGTRATLFSFRGQVVIVEFGDVACSVCQEMDRMLREYQFEYLDRGLVVISVNEHTTLDALRQYDAQFMFSMLTGVDPGQVIALRYHVTALPTMVFIDRDGNVRDIRQGRVKEEQLVHRLQQLL